MAKTTAPPRVNILDAFPELAKLAATTIRLHPRRGEVSDPMASKIGGTFLWSADETWPTWSSQRPPNADLFTLPDWRWDFPDGTPIAYVPILQINARDVPDFPFPAGNDLMQLLWLPLDLNEPPYFCFPRIFWRNTTLIQNALITMPLSPFANPIYIPR